MNFERKLFKITDSIFIGVIIALSLLVYFVPQINKASDNIAVISVDGVECKRVNLEDTPNSTFTINSLDGYIFEIKDNSIGIKKAPCNDKVCVHSGYTHSSKKSIICLPQKLEIRILDDSENSADIIIG